MNSNHGPIVCLHTTIQMEMIETEVQFQTVCENEERRLHFSTWSVNLCIAQRTLSAHEFRLYHGVAGYLVGYTSNFYSIPFMDRINVHYLRIVCLCYLR